MSWTSPVAAHVPPPQGQDKFLGMPPPPMYTLPQSPGQPTPDTFPSSPMYVQYSPQVAVPPPSFGQQYSPAVPPPNPQLFVVANPQMVAGVPPPQFTPGGAAPYQVGFVQPVASQASAMPPVPPPVVSSAGVVASPPQQYVVANQPVMVQPVNPPFVGPTYARKSFPGGVVPQQVVMVPAQQYVVPPPAQPGMPPPQAASQVYSVVAGQSIPQPNGPPAVVQPVMTGQRVPLQVAAALPNQFQPFAVPASQLPVLPSTNPMQPVAVQMVPANVLGIASANQPPASGSAAPPANQMQQSFATSQPVYCYMPTVSAGSVPSDELRPPRMSEGSSLSVQQPPTATASIQV